MTTSVAGEPRVQHGHPVPAGLEAPAGTEWLGRGVPDGTPGLVRVILSTWNSERHVRPLLDSVLAQDYRPLELVVRDDGSADATPAILREYAARHDNLRVELGPNIGMVRSYFRLLHAYAPGADFLALCDHDDVWHGGKIARAAEWLAGHARAHGQGAPAMYTGRLRIVDEEGRFLELAGVPARPMTIGNALVENVAGACTMLLNAPARDLMLETRDVTGVRWPDWWYYLVMCSLGTVLFDAEPQIDYRRHGGNAVGSPSGWNRVRFAWRQARDGVMMRQLTAQAEALRRVYGTRLPSEARAILEEFLERPRTLPARLRQALGARIHRQRRAEGLVIRTMLFLAGRSR